MKKFVFVLTLILSWFACFLNNQEVSFAQTNQIVVNTSYSYLYKDETLVEHYPFKIKSNEVLVCLQETDKYYKVSYTFEDVEYTGFVPYEFASTFSPGQDLILVYNGRITRQTNVYDITTSQILDNIKLKYGDQIYIYEGFDSKKEFTNIKFSYNGEIYTGKVYTKDLSPNGVNKGIIIALSIISALVGVVLILLGLNTKKWHKSLKKKKN